MQTFIVRVHIPDEVYRERKINSFQLVDGDHLVHWKIKEFNKFMPGRSWRRFDTSLGVLALQYETTHSVRIVIRQTDEQTARDQISSYIWGLKPKAPRKKYTYKN